MAAENALAGVGQVGQRYLGGAREAALRHDAVTAGEDDRLAEHTSARTARASGRRREPAGAPAGVEPEERDARGPLDELHGRRLARVHLDRHRHPPARDEVHAVEPSEAECLDHRARQGLGPGVQLVLPLEQRGASGGEETAAVAEPVPAERALAHELPRDAERYRVAPVGHEYDGARHTANA